MSNARSRKKKLHRRKRNPGLRRRKAFLPMVHERIKRMVTRKRNWKLREAKKKDL